MLNGDQAGTNDLGHVGALVQAEPQHRGHEGRNQRVRIGLPLNGGERDANSDVWKHKREVVPEEDLHQDRRTAKKPDVQPAHRRYHRVGRQPHDGEDDSKNDPDEHGQDGQLERGDDALQDQPVREVVTDHAPLQVRGGDECVEHFGGDCQDDNRRHPAPGVSDRDRLDRRRAS